jgi:arginine decarboxylase
MRLTMRDSSEIVSPSAPPDSAPPPNGNGNGHAPNGNGNGHAPNGNGGTGLAPPQRSDVRERARELDHSRAPYLDALRAYAAREPGRFHVPGHKGGLGANPQLKETFGEDVLALDIPLVIHGIDVGEGQTPLEQARRLAADAWGAKRTWFLSNGATQGNHAACLALKSMGDEVVVQRNVHASTIDGLVLAGMQPKWVAPELNPDLGIAHCLTPESLDITLADSPGAVGVLIVSPTYFGAVADVRALADVAHSWGVPLIVDEAWGSHFPFHEALPQQALLAGADLVLSGTHKLVGSFAQSAMLHLAHGAGGRLDERAIDRALTLVASTSPSSLLLGSLDAARRHAVLEAPELIEEGIVALAETREAIRSQSLLEVLDERLLRHPGVYDYDPLRLAIDVRGTGASGHELGALLREQSDINLELCSESMVVAVFGISEPIAESCRRLLDGLERALAGLSRRVSERERRSFGAPPRWGPLAMSPREAFLGPQEAVPIELAVGRVAAESLAAYPPGIPNVFPGERITAETISYIKRTLEQGGSVRGLTDPSLRTVRVATEDRR